MKKKSANIFLGKKILVYGLGRTGISSYKFLKKKAAVYLFDDNPETVRKINKKCISLEELRRIKLEPFATVPSEPLKPEIVLESLIKRSTPFPSALD